MIYKRGKGAGVYHRSGFRNYGCLMNLLLFPFQVIIIAIITVIKRIRGEKK
jgi:hypothetical protein